MDELVLECERVEGEIQHPQILDPVIWGRSGVPRRALFDSSCRTNGSLKLLDRLNQHNRRS